MRKRKATPTILVESTEKMRTFKNIVLKGTSMIRVEMVISTYNVFRELNSETGQTIQIRSKRLIDEEREQLEFPLTEVTPRELAIYRKNGVPSFVLKNNDRLYHAVIPNNISFLSSSILGEHKCACNGNVCNRLSAASDGDGGCAKVRGHASNIEKYPWIVFGYETFNNIHEALCVIQCQHYEKSKSFKVDSTNHSNSAEMDLARFLWL